MGRHSLKRKETTKVRPSAPAEIPKYPPTIYEHSPATLKNFPLSIVNGVTRENGLYSLTLKSINCETYVEQNENMRRVLKKPKLEAPKRISDLDLEAVVKKLTEDVEYAKNQNLPILKENNAEINELYKNLNDVLKGGDDTNETLVHLRKKLLDFATSSGVVFREGKYAFNTSLIIPDFPIDRAEDVRDDVKSVTSLEQQSSGGDKVSVTDNETKNVDVAAHQEQSSGGNNVDVAAHQEQSSGGDKVSITDNETRGGDNVSITDNETRGGDDVSITDNETKNDNIASHHEQSTLSVQPVESTVEVHQTQNSVPEPVADVTQVGVSVTTTNTSPESPSGAENDTHEEVEAEEEPRQIELVSESNGEEAHNQQTTPDAAIKEV